MQSLENYATEQALLRDNGQANEIDTILAGTPAEGMNTDDFMDYMADFPCGYVQYGQASEMCANYTTYATLSDQDLFTTTV